MQIVFVHGWSVTNTSTYGGLPEALADMAANAGLDIQLQHIWLGKYVSFHDEVTMNDLVRGLDRALRDTLPLADGGALPPFSCITHSTGGPVLREWVEQYFGKDRLDRLPLRHLVMLAPANHGSPLAALGKERVGRLKAWFQGVEPGVRILQWLSLGSDAQWRLTERWADYKSVSNSFFPFVLTGQTIDTKLYDFINPYLVEVGSDGVVRSCCANLNGPIIRLTQTEDELTNTKFSPRRALRLAADTDIRRPEPLAFGVVPQASHSGTAFGIMNSVTRNNAATKMVVSEILACLQVKTASDYDTRRNAMDNLTLAAQKADTRSGGHRYVNMVVRVTDDQGQPVPDYDFYLLGKQYDPGRLPKGFFIDRQRNAETPNCLVYYLDYDVMASLPDEQFGLRVAARPSKGFARYRPAEFRTNGTSLQQMLRANETIYLDIVLRREVHPNVFRFAPATQPREDFKKTKGFPEE